VGAWLSATFLMRNTYFRPLATPIGDASAYAVARESGDRLAKDLFYPAIFVSGMVVTCGVIAILRSKKGPNQALLPTTMTVTAPAGQEPRRP